jgi:hypothetical protein
LTFPVGVLGNNSFYVYCLVWIVVSYLDLLTSLLNLALGTRETTECITDINRFALYSLYETLVYAVFLRSLFE